MTNLREQNALDAQIDEAGILPLEDEEFYYELPEPLARRFASVERKESPSSLNPWFDCPMKWWAVRYAPLASDAVVDDLFPALVGGSVVHRAIEVFYSEPPELRTDDHFDDILIRISDILDSTMNEEEAAAEGIVSSEDITRWRDVRRRGKDWMQRYLNGIWDIARSILDVDDDPTQVVIVSNEQYVSRWINGVKFACKIDRLMESESGTLLIDDYKTGKPPVDAEDINILTKRYIQPGIYAWVLSRKNQMIEAVRMIYLKKPAVYRINIHDDSIDLIDRLLYRITGRMTNSAENGGFYTVPDQRESKGRCFDCPLKGNCPVRDGASDEDLLALMDLDD